MQSDGSDLATLSAGALARWMGVEIGVSRGGALDPSRIDDVAAIAEHGPMIPIRSAKAASTRFGGTTAHGFLTLSMLAMPPAMAG